MQKKLATTEYVDTKYNYIRRIFSVPILFRYDNMEVLVTLDVPFALHNATVNLIIAQSYDTNSFEIYTNNFRNIRYIDDSITFRCTFDKDMHKSSYAINVEIEFINS